MEESECETRIHLSAVWGMVLAQDDVQEVSPSVP